MNTFNRRRSNHSSSAHLKEVKNGGKSRVKQGHYEKCSRSLLSDHDLFPTTFKVLKTAGGRTWTFDCDVTVGRYPVYLIEPCWMQWDHVWLQKVRGKPLRARTRQRPISSVFKGYTGRFATTIFTETQRCNVVTIRNNVATMLQRCVALKIIIANRLV